MIIYKIENKINGMIYIGQTTRTLKKRLYQHFNLKTHNSYVSNAIKKYGKDNFNYDVIYNGVDVADLNEKEIQFISDYNCVAPNGYNLELGGKNSPHNEISKKKLSEAHKGKKLTKEHCGNISDGLIKAHKIRIENTYEKECNECGCVMSLDLFVKDSSYKSGYRGKCIDCISDQRRKHYDLNKIEINRKRREKARLKRQQKNK